MEFGIFDHLDRYDGLLADYYEERLRLIELYDRGGFYAYHVAEHHATPLGMAASPSIFLSAVAQRTRRLRFGPMVYALPLYHPLRILEEICMLDQLSGGRLEIGFGRGASPIELAYFGRDPEEAERLYQEALALVLKGFTEKRLSCDTPELKLDNVPVELETRQKPHPPLWYGLHSPSSAERVARQALNVICLDPTEASAAAIARYRAAWREAHGERPEPKIGIGRFVVVAETDAEALALARRAYPQWFASFDHLNRRHGRVAVHQRPAEWDALAGLEQGIAGSPRTVADFVASQMRGTGANYFVGQLAFGDLSFGEAKDSIERFIAQVMPAVRTRAGAAA
jgi:alkanesulfonate monooxygenase SsuD/methylene tetrahydromethanopterin reductase-like flavin-dependent oxidoreductase (luciferase family)